MPARRTAQDARLAATPQAAPGTSPPCVRVALAARVRAATRSTAALLLRPRGTRCRGDGGGRPGAGRPAQGHRSGEAGAGLFGAGHPAGGGHGPPLEELSSSAAPLSPQLRSHTILPIPPAFLHLLRAQRRGVACGQRQCRLPATLEGLTGSRGRCGAASATVTRYRGAPCDATRSAERASCSVSVVVFILSLGLPPRETLHAGRYGVRGASVRRPSARHTGHTRWAYLSLPKTL